MKFITLPGIGGSGSGHWQTLWERSNVAMQRFAPPSWDNPDLAQWCEALEDAISKSGHPVVLVAHSLSCLLVAHWAPRSPSTISGAFLVAVPDPASVVFPREASSFGSPPRHALPFPSMIVTSTDDPYGSLDYARRCAAIWGSELVNIGNAGHINGASNLGSWPAGAQLLEGFVSSLSA